MAELVGLIVGSVSLFGQGWTAYKNYRQRRNQKKAAQREATLSKELETSGPVVKSEYDKGIEIFGDALAHFTDSMFPCLNLPIITSTA